MKEGLAALQWHCRRFDELPGRELYAILKLRSQVFVVEQNCVYQDMDDKDFDSYHLFAVQDGCLCAYSRLLPPGLAYVESTSVGRVVVSPNFRRLGLGRLLMEKSLQSLTGLYGKFPVTIMAQTYLQEFYASLHFRPQGAPFEEDGIPHITMMRESI